MLYLIIIKIQRLRGKHPRYDVHLDGVLTLKIGKWTIGKFGLRTGDAAMKPTFYVKEIIKWQKRQVKNIQLTRLEI